MICSHRDMTSVPAPWSHKAGAAGPVSRRGIHGSHSYNRKTSKGLQATEAYPSRHQLNASSAQLLSWIPKIPMAITIPSNTRESVTQGKSE